MTKLLSLVGLQPTAVAVAVKTWSHHNGPPNEVVLMPTPRTEPVAERLADWLDHQSIRCRKIEPRLWFSEGQFFPDIGKLSTVLQSVCGPDDQIVFLADPGPRQIMLSWVHLLRDRAKFLNSDDKTLRVRALFSKHAWENEYPLQDVGLILALELYGIKLFQNTLSEFPILDPLLEQFRGHSQIHTVRNVKLGEGSATAAAAYEKRGQAFLLFEENDAIAVRDILRWEADAGELRPRIAVVSWNKRVIERVQHAGQQAIRRKDRDHVLMWLKGNVPAPGFRRSILPETPVPRVVRAVGARGWQTGPDLAVCLGTDASSTLVAIATHRPRRVWIFIDPHSPTVRLRALSLCDSVGALPVQEICFVDLDRLGGNASAAVETVLSGKRPVICNLTPGTKAQSCALAALPSLPFWMIDPSTQRAVAFEDEREPIAINALDIRTTAAICGGPLRRGGTLENPDQSRREFLGAYLRFMADWVRSHPKKEEWRINTVCERVSNYGRIVVEKRSAKRTKLVLNTKEKTVTGWLSTGAHGDWLEQVVVAAFVECGATEVVRGLQWRWEADDDSRTEIDVIARFGAQFAVVECKARKNAAAFLKRSIEAEARNLGRSCLPVLVRPRVAKRDLEESVTLRRGALMLDLESLCTPVSLADTVLRALAARRLLAQD